MNLKIQQKMQIICFENCELSREMQTANQTSTKSTTLLIQQYANIITANYIAMAIYIHWNLCIFMLNFLDAITSLDSVQYLHQSVI